MSIPDAAVEAAARVLYAKTRALNVSDIRAALEAAAPHMNKSGAILTPCCDAPISVSVGGFSGEIEIYCPADGCYTTWNDDGEKDS